MQGREFEINKDEVSFGNLPTEKVLEYLQKEAEWIDAIFGEFWPKPVVSFARWQNRRMARGKMPNFFMRTLIFFFARISGLKITRNKHMSMPGKGFRPGTILLDRITVTVHRHGKEVAKKDFSLSVIT